jgi:hypothetical protein
MRFRCLIAILRHRGADLTTLVCGLRRGRTGQQQREPHGGHHYTFDHPASTFISNKAALPVAATATKVSTTAEEQKEHNDNQEQFHRRLLWSEATRPWSTTAFAMIGAAQAFVV